jgi:putative transposase
MRENSLMAAQRVHKAKRTSQRSKPRAERPRRYWGIDMTKFMVASLGWIFLIIVLDWFTKKIFGWDLSLRGRSEEWKRALEVALKREFPKRSRRK